MDIFSVLDVDRPYVFVLNVCGRPPSVNSYCKYDSSITYIVENIGQQQEKKNKKEDSTVSARGGLKG